MSNAINERLTNNWENNQGVDKIYKKRLVNEKLKNG